MVQLSQSSHEMFQNERLKAVIPRWCSALRERLPEQTAAMTDSEIEAFCHRWAPRAMALKLDTEYAAFVYLAARLLYGDSLEPEPLEGWRLQVFGFKDRSLNVRLGVLSLNIAHDHRKVV